MSFSEDIRKIEEFRTRKRIKDIFLKYYKLMAPIPPYHGSTLSKIPDQETCVIYKYENDVEEVHIADEPGDELMKLVGGNKKQQF